MKQLWTIIIFLSLLACSQQQENRINSTIRSPLNGLPIDLSKKITCRSLLIVMDTNELRILRNEIYARKGFIFSSEDLRKYFSNFDWYKPLNDKEKVNSLLTEIDIHNINAIKEVERAKEIERLQKQQKKEQFEKIVFMDYVAIIPKIKLPLTFTFGGGLPFPEIDDQNDTIMKFMPDGGSIVGKLYQTANEVAIMYAFPADILLPMVKKYNLEGKDLGEIELINHWCCSDTLEDYSEYNVTIFEDLTVDTETICVFCKNSTENKDCDTIKSTNSFRIK